jgi:formylglycine-generating enzyme required for sulfatase activity
MKKFLLSIMFAALALTALCFTACEGFQQEDPRDQSYEFQTLAKYRETVTVVSGGAVREVSGEGGGGVFATDKVLTTGYSIARYETTWELWSEVYNWAKGHGYSIVNAGTEGHGPDGTGGEDWASAMKKTRPVTGITWQDAIVWCNAYSELSGLQPVYYTEDGSVLRASGGEDLVLAQSDKNGFRLPLEVEWEYAARGGDADKNDWDYTYAGSNAGTPATVAWYNANAAIADSPTYGAHPVGQKTVNRLGLFDMSGNAAEWCFDSYNENIGQGGGPVSGSQRIIRGGSWKSEAVACTVKSRDFQDPFYLNNDVGFRIACTVPDNGDDGNSTEEEETIEDLPPFTGLAGTKWNWGQSLLEFTETNTVIFRGAGPEYSYTVTSMEEGQEGGGNIDTLGDFKVNAERNVLEIIDYRKGGEAVDNRTGEKRVFNAVFKRRDPAVLTPEYLAELYISTLMGTEWNIPVGGGTDGTRFKGNQWIIFFEKKITVNRSANVTNIDDYTFNKNKMRGWIYFINDFILRDWDNMYIPVYKQYGHDMSAHRVR